MARRKQLQPTCMDGVTAVWPPVRNYHRTTWTSPALKRFYERTGKNPAINTAQELYYLSEYREEILAIEMELAEEERTLRLVESTGRFQGDRREVRRG